MLRSLLRRRPLPVPTALDAQGRLASDLWLDLPDAEERIERRRRRGALTTEQAEQLLHFSRDGYMILDLELSEEVYADFDRVLERLWRRKPADVAFAWQGPLQPFSQAVEAEHRRPGYRIADLHSACTSALDLYLDRRIFTYLELIFGEPAVATQSLYFEFGSQQPLHRDPVFVRMSPASHLVAAWIALEDISPRCGPLMYVPGSHKLPYYHHHHGRTSLEQRPKDNDEVVAMADFELAQAQQAGLELRHLTCKRGQVLLWHASLLHGGARPDDPTLTRKSFVVHYSTRAHYPVRRDSILVRVPAGDGQTVQRQRIVETDALLERDGCCGFDNPLRFYRGRRAAAPDAA